ncbi:MAG: hypothetical protein R2755_23885 [Acidimicrobiales bacterium]
MRKPHRSPCSSTGIARQIIVERPVTNAAHPPSMLRARLPADIARLLPGERERINEHTAGVRASWSSPPSSTWSDRRDHQHRQLTVAG